MSQFTSTISDLRKALDRQFDNLLILRNTPSATVDHDAHYAILRLAELVAKEFPSAEPMFSRSIEYLNYRLPAFWQRDTDPCWLVDCPRLTTTYDELLMAPDATAAIGSEAPFLFVVREFRVDYLLARVTVEARIPAEDVTLLQAIGKVQEEFHPSYTSTTLVC